MKIAGHSRETPRRWWLSIPYIGEIRLYRWGVELYVGPSRGFLAFSAGTDGWSASWITE